MHLFHGSIVDPIPQSLTFFMPRSLRDGGKVYFLLTEDYFAFTYPITLQAVFPK